MITYGPNGASFAVWQGERVVLRAKTEEGARSSAERLAVTVGDEPGSVRHREPRAAKPVVVAATPVEPLPIDMGEISVTKFRERVATGEFDGHLTALDAAERAGLNRKGALDAIAARLKVVS